MQVKAVNFKPLNSAQLTQNNPIKKENNAILTKHSSNAFQSYSNYIGSLNRISFKMRNENHEGTPAQRLFWVLSGRDSIYEDDYTKSHIADSGWKKWVEAPAYELLNRSPEQAIQSICTLTKQNDSYPQIPYQINTPDYGNNWGRHANYIEINNRTIAKHQDNRVSEGILGAIKLLPAIPASGDKFANCVVLSQLYPNSWGEGYIEDGASLYTMRLNRGISQNNISDTLVRGNVRLSPEEQVKAFNDLAHMRGLKTGFRMLLSAGQIWVGDEALDWNNKYHEEAFIESCVQGINLGFDSIYFDSAKHIDNYDKGNYIGVGELPKYGQMQYITDQIRKRTGKHNLSFVGEKCETNPRFEEMGFSAGTDYGDPNNLKGVVWSSKEQAKNSNYAAGPEVSNDNDVNFYNFEQRLKRMDSCLFGYENPYDKLPTFMQMHDLFPLTPYTNTHDEMLKSTIRGDGSPSGHIYNIFDTSDAAKTYQHEVNKKFINAIYK